MDFDTQLLIAFVVCCAVAIPILLYKYKKYKKEGKSFKYLELKVLITVGLPIISVPFLLSDMSFFWKTVVIAAMLLSMVGYVYSIYSSRRTFRKIMGLPPEDEHTGDVIKEDNNKK